MRNLPTRILVSLVIACLATPELASLPPRWYESTHPDQGAIRQTGHSLRAHHGHSRSRSLNRCSWFEQDTTPDDLDDESGRICQPFAITEPGLPRISPHPSISPAILQPRDQAFRPASDRSMTIRC